MRQYLSMLPKEIRDLIDLASDLAASKKTPAYLVGGFVRDLLLGVKNFDLDLAVEGDGIQFAQAFARALKSKVVCHGRFGTATVIIDKQVKVDIASARKEFYPRPAHLPVVEPGALKDDHFRRDFTINAMAISLNARDFGRLIDFFGGREDLRNKKIRVLHSLSFIDDPTRILRAIRFEQRFNFNIESNTLRLLKEALRRKMLEKVQPQRARDDLILMLKEEDPVKEIKRLKALAGLDFISKDINAWENTLGLLTSVKAQVKWFLRLKLRKLDSWIIYFMALTDSLTISQTRRLCEKFVFLKGEEKRIISAKELNYRWIRRLGQAKVKASEILNTLRPLSYEAVLFLKAKHKQRYLQAHINDFLKTYSTFRIDITGSDLKALGLSPGPEYQNIFLKILNARIDGAIKTREEQLRLAKKLVTSTVVGKK